MKNMDGRKHIQLNPILYTQIDNETEEKGSEIFNTFVQRQRRREDI